jgi:hypothetical protein
VVVHPGVIAIGIFAWGAKVYFFAVTPPKNVMDFYVAGKQWMWKVPAPDRPEGDQRPATSGRQRDPLHDDVGGRAATATGSRPSV